MLIDPICSQTFWLFQTYLHDLASTPQAQPFKTCRRIYNKVQHIVFGLSDSARADKITENTLPVTVLASFVLASIGLPLLPQIAGPLAVAQARRTTPDGDVISEASQTQNQNQPAKITRSQTVSAQSTRSRRRDPNRVPSAPTATIQEGKVAREQQQLPQSPRVTVARPPSSSGSTKRDAPDKPRKPDFIESKILEARLSSSSLPLPDVRSPRVFTQPATPVSAGFPRPTDGLSRRHSHHVKTLLSQAEMTTAQKAKLLRQNYFRCQTAFLTALEDISNRLVIVPKQARLSALRAELALIARDLPAELDIPIICPPTLVDGSPSKSRHHRIVRVNPAEATVLNSAEKVPYLLMVEILRDDFCFDPESPDNQRLLTTLLAEQGSRKRIFDLSDAPRVSTGERIIGPAVKEEKVDSVFEPSSGDLGSSPMLKPVDDEAANKKHGKLPSKPQRVPSGTTTLSSLSELTLTTPRTSATSTSRSSSPGGLRRMTLQNPKNNSADQPDFSALATHMRTASQMLAQLEATSGKRPKQEVAAIRAKIIASMQNLEEQNFEVNDPQGPTFDMIIARTTAANVAAEAAEIEQELETGMNESAGQARMENDAMTGGVRRKGDRDDPSAAVFGEAWEQKKERIRKSSPYGWMKNWDLVSVIVKTGADLRQEAFACQLIQACDKIWTDAGTPVWVKVMRILVTGESSGLIETITNGVSLHSLKRSLTLALIESGQNPRRRIATLRDHFIKTFGPTDSEPHKAAVDAFKRSLAAYSMISYVLQLKDRHNGNVLIDNEGHIVHIDFGFMLSNSPGSVGFEAAPFKFTYEYLEVLGGVGTQDYDDFKKLCKQAFQALRRSADNIIDLVSMMGRDSKMPCFAVGITTVTATLRQRFQLHLSAEEAENFVETDLIAKSLGSYYTRLYDTFQYRTQGIY
ncbi:kinase-like domain-containing protein [Truncatella angustata]|uniref:1-phosphatidylinositol 4-kinase n=1 Tax=Truncatella angustata TaxID=152316 RepID=A0A9P8UL95_9PEZI|nr:kinase-like domain-containing protein [Truncatella angustata]KAH6654625.1 kinase-like domain-containing protein [Truncatella angustata]